MRRHIYYGLTLAVFAVLLAFPASAAQPRTDTIVDDPTIESVTVDSVSSTDPGTRDVTIELTFTTNDTISSNTGFFITAQSTDCHEKHTWDDCQYRLDDLTDSDISGIAGSIDTDETWVNNMLFRNSSTLAAGTHTITLSNLNNPDYTGGQRFYISTPASDTSGINDWATTKTDPFTLGDILVTGTITDDDGNAIQTFGQVYDDQWNANNGFDTDEWGFYAVRDNGFSSGDKVFLTIYPDTERTGYTTTTKSFTYTGTTKSFSFTPLKATKTVSGKITYSDTGGAVDSAGVYANSPNGGWTNANANDNGQFELTLAGGEYEVCVTDKWEDGQMVEKDWWVRWEDSCQKVSFKNDNTTESATVNLAVNKADATVTGVFKNPDGSFPENGGWVSFWRDDLWFGGDVSNEDGSFSVSLVGGNSNVDKTTLSATATGSTVYNVQYQPHSSDEYTYWGETKIEVKADATLNLGVITLSERDVVFTATVVDTDGNPIQGIYVDAWQNNGGWDNEETDANGQATLLLYEGEWTVRPSTWNTPDYVFADKEYRQTFTANSTGSHTFTVKGTTLTVTMNARDGDGNLTEVQGWADCWSEAYGGFGKQLDYGTAVFGAIGGTYHCHISTPQNSDYQAQGEKHVTFVDGVDQTLDFTMLERTSTARINVKDQDNNMVKNQEGWVNAWSDNESWSDARLENDGTAEMRLAAGRYHFGVWFPDESDYISSWSYDKGMSIADGETKTKTISVHKVTGRLRAKLLDADGNPIDRAWVGCGNYGEMENVMKGDFDGGKLIESGAGSGGDGIAVVGLVADHVYECWVGTPPDSGLIAPHSKEIDLTKQDETTTTFRFKKSNAKIKGKVSFAATSDAARTGAVTEADISDLWCNGWAEEGFNSWDDSHDASYSINAIKGTWNVWCDGFVVDEDGERHWYHSKNEKRVKVTGPGVYGGNHIKLTESFFEIPESVSVTFDSTALKTIVLDGGTTLSIPANALATEGNVTITAEPELHPVRTYGDTPFGIPWNFEAYDSDGTLISGNFNQNASIIISYNEDALEEYGIEENNILPKVWDDESGTWKTVDGALQDMQANTVTFSVAHFSQVGLTYGTQTAVNQGKKKAPKKVRIKAGSRKARGFTVAWKKRKTAKKYRVQVYNMNGKLVQTYKVKKKKRTRKITGLNPNKRYKVRVAQIIDGRNQRLSKFVFTWTKPAKTKQLQVRRSNFSEDGSAAVDFSFNVPKRRVNLEAVIVVFDSNGDPVPFSLNGGAEGDVGRMEISKGQKQQDGTVVISPEYLGQELKMVIKVVSTRRKPKTNTSPAANLLLAL
ncbi:fibronectin type III domain-containing protein [Patescibacteria group bacterium]